MKTTELRNLISRLQKAGKRWENEDTQGNFNEYDDLATEAKNAIDSILASGKRVKIVMDSTNIHIISKVLLWYNMTALRYEDDRGYYRGCGLGFLQTIEVI